MSHPEIQETPRQRIEKVLVDDLSDPQLVLVAARGRAEALAEVYRRHAGAVFGLARRITADVGDAEDVTQEIFIGLWSRPERFDPSRGSLRTYLLTQAHSRSVDLVRSRNARLGREQRDAESQRREGTPLDREMENLVLADQVGRALTDLPPDERIAIELAYFDGLTYRQVAAVLRAPDGTIKTRIRGGLRRMRAMLTEESTPELTEDQ